MHSSIVTYVGREAPNRSVREDARFAGLAYWAAQLGWWGWHFWWEATGEAIIAAVPLTKAAAVWGGVCLTGLVATELLRQLSKRWAWLELDTNALLLRLAASVLVLAVITFAVTMALAMVVYGKPVTAMMSHRLSLFSQIFNEFLGPLFTYLTWVAAYFGVALIRARYRSQMREAYLAESLKAAELRSLKSQLNPHFLFNALNGLRALVIDDPARAREAITQLAHTLRYALDSGREELVTLSQELAMVDDYLALESLRLAERLKVVHEIDPAATTARIPVMLLQTLVENAIKHGIAPLREGGTLRIGVHITGHELEIDVENPRPAGPSAGPGLGLGNAARRLELLFGTRARLSLDLTDSHRAKATARLPI